MGNAAVSKVETNTWCCTEASTNDMPEDMITADLAQALFLHEVPIHLAASMEEAAEGNEEAGGGKPSSPKRLLDRLNGQAMSSASMANRKKLITAVQKDDAPGVLQLVADGADVVDMGEALRLASGRGSASVVRELVAVGLSVNESDPHSNFTPLQLAAAGGHMVVCELLLDALADVHRQIGGVTALTLARKMGNIEVEEVIERHVAALMMSDQGNGADDAAQYRRAHVLPRVSAVLSEAVLSAVPADDELKNEEMEMLREGSEDGETSEAAVTDVSSNSGNYVKYLEDGEPEKTEECTVLSVETEAFHKNLKAKIHQSENSKEASPRANSKERAPESTGPSTSPQAKKSPPVEGTAKAVTVTDPL